MPVASAMLFCGIAVMGNGYLSRNGYNISMSSIGMSAIAAVVRAVMAEYEALAAAVGLNAIELSASSSGRR